MQEMQEMRAQSLDQEDPLEKERVTHSTILAWKIPWMEETIEYYSAIKKINCNVILPFAEMWMALKDFMLSEMSEKDKYVEYKNMTLIHGI